MFDNEVVNVTKEKGQHQVELKDGSAIDYDGVVLATGVTKQPRTIEGSHSANNISMFECRKDHQSVKNALETGIKNLTVFGLNMEALEFVSTV